MCTIMTFKNFVDVCNDTHGLLPRSHLVQLACAVCVGQLCSPSILVLEPDPWKNRKEGLEVYRAPGMQACFRLFNDCMFTYVYWKYKHKLLVQSKETKNIWDLLVREVVGAQH